MKYFTAITTLICLNIFSVVALLYFGNNSRTIEEENKFIQNKISHEIEQLKVNKIEFTLFNDYDYLIKMKKIYFNQNIISSSKSIRLNLKDYNSDKLMNIYKASSKQ
tara:strand:- start:4428 stop:4748 length:321 start_codon:yes stop_codon:yes gene_type:complete